MHKYQKGFGTIEVVLVLIIFGIIALVGYFVLNAQRKSDTLLQTGTVVVAKNPAQITVDKTKIPLGWNISTNDGTNFVIDNEAIDRADADRCFVNVFVKKDTLAKSNDATYADTLEFEATKAASDNKGYVYTKLPSESIHLRYNGASQIYVASANKIMGPDNALFGYSKTTYIVSNGKYTGVNLTCGNQDFSAADKVLEAVSVNL